ncbi:endonuclease/exonuclease/phosphatase family protein [Gracilinema caldarium]|uniref:endonuclease/exonuclease/phosphatase family protein n=1 Tax=Gracilinema caldarium TaxID=215591 RepID=UPI0026F17CE3|nr:endonuclease/exonuclease/phosphatase family protein [Gracilinema caldarium]
MNKAVLLLPLFFLGCTGCENPLAKPKKQTHFRLASWNLQAFFDGQEAGTEYADFTAKASWNEVAYKSRLQVLSDAMGRWGEVQTQGDIPGPDMFALIEIENAQVLADLLAGPLASFKYTYSAFAINPGAPLGLALASRFPITATRCHSIQTPSFSAPRPMLEAEIELPGKEGEKLIVFVCHWKSKLGSIKETEAIRRASAQLVNRRIQELVQDRSGKVPLFLVAGDLNENIDEYDRQGTTILTALMPAGISLDPYPEAALSPRPCLMVTDSVQELPTFTEDPALLYSPWNQSEWQGSYAYQSAWEKIDHILLGYPFFDNLGWDYAGFSVLDHAPFVNDAGYPNSFNPRTRKGLSDHLPIVADFKQHSP